MEHFLPGTRRFHRRTCSLLCDPPARTAIRMEHFLPGTWTCRPRVLEPRLPLTAAMHRLAGAGDDTNA